jgi:hypothetical protein
LSAEVTIADVGFSQTTPGTTTSMAAPVPFRPGPTIFAPASSVMLSARIEKVVPTMVRTTPGLTTRARELTAMPPVAMPSEAAITQGPGGGDVALQ